jgi:hypothetical protein
MSGTMMINLNLTVEQVNAILFALSKQPYGDVADLIHRIKVDAEAQLAPKPTVPDED